MRIFTAFAFRPRDEWIEELVFPLIHAFGHATVTGEDLAGAGEGISTEVKKRIDSCDGLVGFTTRRIEPNGTADPPAGGWPTHRWVQDELVYAATSSKIPVIEVRETGVRDDNGLLEDLQRISYDESCRDACLINLAKAIGWWSRSLAVELNLFLPVNDMAMLRTLLVTESVTCTYEVRRGYTTLPKTGVKIEALRGNFVIVLRRVEPGDLVRVQLHSDKQTWSSSFEPVDSPGIRIESLK